MEKQVLVLPPEFNRNCPNVAAMASPAQTGYSLLEYMASRMGLKDLGECDVLDFGCGGRFAESILNLDYPVKTYVGLDVFKPLMDFLTENVHDPRLKFYHVNLASTYFNPTGEIMSARTKLPVAEKSFDVACMFSVITHQQPNDAKAIF